MMLQVRPLIAFKCWADRNYHDQPSSHVLFVVDREEFGFADILYESSDLAERNSEDLHGTMGRIHTGVPFEDRFSTAPSLTVSVI